MAVRFSGIEELKKRFPHVEAGTRGEEFAFAREIRLRITNGFKLTDGQWKGFYKCAMRTRNPWPGTDRYQCRLFFHKLATGKRGTLEASFIDEHGRQGKLNEDRGGLFDYLRSKSVGPDFAVHGQVVELHARLNVVWCSPDNFFAIAEVHKWKWSDAVTHAEEIFEESKAGTKAKGFAVPTTVEELAGKKPMAGRKSTKHFNPNDDEDDLEEANEEPDTRCRHSGAKTGSRYVLCKCGQQLDCTDDGFGRFMLPDHWPPEPKAPKVTPEIEPPASAGAPLPSFGDWRSRF